MAIKETVSVDDAITLLNEAVQIDRAAVEALIGNRVPCNDALADHPSIRVCFRAGDDFFSVGFLGMLNGVFGTYEDGVASWGAITWAKEIGGEGRFVRTDSWQPASFPDEATRF